MALREGVTEVRENFGHFDDATVAGHDAPALAELRTPDGTFTIQERRRTPRPADASRPTVSKGGAETAHVPDRARPGQTQSGAGSAQMMGLGGVIILLVLVGSYTQKYDAAIGHAGGALAVPAVGYLALQVFLARAALRLFDDVRRFASLPDFVLNRAFRYLPAVVPAVLLGFAIVNCVALPGFAAPLTTLPANLLMLSDMVGTPGIDASHWRLKIEIIQAVLVAAAWFGPLHRHLAVLLTIALATTVASLDGEPVRQHVLSLSGLMTNDGYVPHFVFGVALYQAVHDRGSRIWQALLCAAAALVFLSNTPAHGAIVVAGLAVLTVTAMGGLTFMGRYRWLTHLGELAFPIYVVHYLLGFAIIHRLEHVGCPPALAMLAAAAAAILVGKALNAGIERPLQARGPAFVKAAHALLEARFPAIGVFRGLGSRDMARA